MGAWATGVWATGAWATGAWAGGGTGSISITFNPPAGKSYVDLSGYPHATAYVLGDGASPALADGDQIEYDTTASSGATVTVNADGSFVLSTTTPASFAYRVWDATDSTWSGYATVYVNIPASGMSKVSYGFRFGF